MKISHKTIPSSELFLGVLNGLGSHVCPLVGVDQILRKQFVSGNVRKLRVAYKAYACLPIYGGEGSGILLYGEVQGEKESDKYHCISTVSLSLGPKNYVELSGEISRAISKGGNKPRLLLLLNFLGTICCAKTELSQRIYAALREDILRYIPQEHCTLIGGFPLIAEYDQSIVPFIADKIIQTLSESRPSAHAPSP